MGSFIIFLLLLKYVNIVSFGELMLLQNDVQGSHGIATIGKPNSIYSHKIPAASVSARLSKNGNEGASDQACIVRSYNHFALITEITSRRASRPVTTPLLFVVNAPLNSSLWTREIASDFEHLS